MKILYSYDSDDDIWQIRYINVRYTLKERSRKNPADDLTTSKNVEIAFSSIVYFCIKRGVSRGKQHQVV